MAQHDTLPNFSVRTIAPGKISIGWINSYDSVKQLNIQRSFDSLFGYKTILAVPDPSSKTNGYLDTKAQTDYMFYRLFIQLDKGQFIFSTPRRPIRDTGSFIATNDAQPDQQVSINTSIPPKNNFVLNSYVFIGADGDLKINLPGLDAAKFRIKFFEDPSGIELFELKNLKEKSFKIDRSSFYHSGWFMFELFEGDKLFLKNYIYLPKPF